MTFSTFSSVAGAYLLTPLADSSRRYLNPADGPQFPGAALYTRRDPDGRPDNPQIAYKESLLAQRGGCSCAICFAKRSPTRAGITLFLGTPLTVTNFVIDHTDDDESSKWTKEHYTRQQLHEWCVYEDQMKRLKIQILCHTCNARKSYESPPGSQGDSRRRGSANWLALMRPPA